MIEMHPYELEGYHEFWDLDAKAERLGLETAAVRSFFETVRDKPDAVILLNKT